MRLHPHGARAPGTADTPASIAGSQTDRREERRLGAEACNVAAAEGSIEAVSEVGA
jgi:hypothetical protein